jgi:GTP-binding protein Era
MRSGYVSIIGRPNSGKSTLLNTLVNSKVAIVSNKPETTRNNIKGIYHKEDTEIVFIDTPGIHKPQDGMSKYLNNQAYDSFDDADIIMFIVDGSEMMGTGDKYVASKLEGVNKPVILVLNKIDKLNKEQIMSKIMEYKDLYPFTEIVPVSALKSQNIQELIKTLKQYLPDTVKYYEDSDITEQSMEFRLSEIIREKVFRLTMKEVPYACACRIDSISYGRSVKVIASIIVDRESLKKILIGKNGQMIKLIGSRSREDMEVLLNKHVFLDLEVKVIDKWRENPKYLNELGNFKQE